MQESPANPESREAAPGPGEPLVSCAASNGSPRQDLGRGQWDMAFKADKDVIYHLCEVAGGKVVYGGCDNKVYVGNLKTGKRSKTFTVEELDVCCLAVDPNDDSIFFTSGSEVFDPDCAEKSVVSIRKWSITTVLSSHRRSCIGKVTLQGFEVWNILLLDSDRVIVGCSDGHVRVTSFSSGGKHMLRYPHETALQPHGDVSLGACNGPSACSANVVHAVARCGMLVATGSRVGVVHLWRASPDGENLGLKHVQRLLDVRTVQPPPGALTTESFDCSVSCISMNNRYIAVSSYNKYVYIFRRHDHPATGAPGPAGDGEGLVGNEADMFPLHFQMELVGSVKSIDLMELPGLQGSSGPEGRGEGDVTQSATCHASQCDAASKTFLLAGTADSEVVLADVGEKCVVWTANIRSPGQASQRAESYEVRFMQDGRLSCAILEEVDGPGGNGRRELFEIRVFRRPLALGKSPAKDRAQFGVPFVSGSTEIAVEPLDAAPEPSCDEEAVGQGGNAVTVVRGAPRRSDRQQNPLRVASRKRGRPPTKPAKRGRGRSRLSACRLPEMQQQHSRVRSSSARMNDSPDETVIDVDALDGSEHENEATARKKPRSHRQRAASRPLRHVPRGLGVSKFVSDEEDIQPMEKSVSDAAANATSGGLEKLHYREAKLMGASANAAVPSPGKIASECGKSGDGGDARAVQACGHDLQDGFLAVPAKAALQSGIGPNNLGAEGLVDPPAGPGRGCEPVTGPLAGQMDPGLWLDQILGPTSKSTSGKDDTNNSNQVNFMTRDLLPGHPRNEGVHLDGNKTNGALHDASPGDTKDCPGVPKEVSVEGFEPTWTREDSSSSELQFWCKVDMTQKLVHTLKQRKLASCMAAFIVECDIDREEEFLAILVATVSAFRDNGVQQSNLKGPGVRYRWGSPCL